MRVLRQACRASLAETGCHSRTWHWARRCPGLRSLAARPERGWAAPTRRAGTASTCAEVGAVLARRSPAGWTRALTGWSHPSVSHAKKRAAPRVVRPSMSFLAEIPASRSRPLIRLEGPAPDASRWLVWILRHDAQAPRNGDLCPRGPPLSSASGRVDLQAPASLARGRKPSFRTAGRRGHGPGMQWRSRNH